MKPAIVVDVGNSRIKWGRCSQGAVVETVALPANDPVTWNHKRQDWITSSTSLPTSSSGNKLLWTIAGVHPERRDELAGWIESQGDAVQVLGSFRDLPLEVCVDYPEQVGLDRLLNAVAARSRLMGQAASPSRDDSPAIVIDAGTAITVDYIDDRGSFLGGAIMPGLRLLAQALHDHTALLPLVSMATEIPTVPAKSTESAIAAGVFWAAAGGIRALIGELLTRHSRPAEMFLTGGDASLLGPALDQKVLLWPAMTLEGIRLSAEALP